MSRAIGWFIGIFFLTVAPGLAQQSGEAALKAWIVGARSIGFDVQHGPFQADGDQIVVGGLKIGRETTFSLRGFGFVNIPDPLQLSLSFEYPQVTIHKLNSTPEGYSAKRVSFGDGSLFRVDVHTETARVFRYQNRVYGHMMEDLFLPRLPPKKKGKKDESNEFGVFVDVLRRVRVSRDRSAVTRGDLIFFDEPRTEETVATSFEYIDYQLQDVAGGIIGRHIFSQMKETTEYGAKADQLPTQTSSSLGSETRNINVVGLLELFNSQSSGSGEYTPIIGSAVTHQYRQESEGYALAVEKLAFEDMSMRAPNADLAAHFDLAFAEQETDDNNVTEGFGGLVQIYRMYSLGRATADGVVVEMQTDDAGISGRIGQLLLLDFSSEKLGELSAMDIDLDVGGAVSFTAKKMAVGGMDFAPLGPLMTFIRANSTWEGADDLEVLRALLPRSIALELRDLSATLTDEPGELVVDRIHMDLLSSVPPIPTRIEIVTQGLGAPVAMGNDDNVVRILNEVGIETLRFDEDIKIRWDDETEDLIVDNLTLEVGQMFKLRAKARFGGLQRSLLENPAQIEALVFTMNVKSAELEFQDEGFFEFTLTQEAKQRGIHLDRIREEMRADIKRGLVEVGNDQFTAMVLPAIEAFIADPRNLHVKIAPASPVPISVIMSDAMIAPDALPERLGVTVEANR